MSPYLNRKIRTPALAAAETDAATLEALMAQGMAFRAAVVAARWNIDGPAKELRHFGEMFDSLIHDTLNSAHGCIVNALDECGVEAPSARSGRAA